VLEEPMEVQEKGKNSLCRVQVKAQQIGSWLVVKVKVRRHESRFLLLAPLCFSSCTSTILKIPKLALTFYLEKGTVVECAIHQSRSESYCFLDEEVFQKQIVNKLLIFGLLNPED